MLLTTGARGEAVARLVDDLRAADFRLPRGDRYDRAVRRSVEAFQARALDASGTPLVVDGKVGPHTRWALRAQLDQIAPTAATVVLPPPMPGGSVIGRAALEVALAEMAAGRGETIADNEGPDVERYLRGRSPRRWCAAFVSWCFREARGGEKNGVFGYRTRATTIHNVMKEKGHDYPATLAAPPEPGDIIVWRRVDPNNPGSQTWRGHCGIVYGYANGNLWTVEGNRGSFPSKVRAFRYSWVNLVASPTSTALRRLYGMSRHP